MTFFELISDPNYKNKHVLEKLLMHHLNLQSKTDIIANYDNEISPDILPRILSDYDEYVVSKKPLEYILGYVEFFGVRFAVNSDTLIPRPETEYMIDALRDLSSKNLKDKNILVDVGTGCGVLGISGFLHTKDFFDKLVLTEYFAPTLEVAKKNANTILPAVKIQNTTFLEMDLLADFDISLISDFDNIVLVANLPYIPDATFENDVEDNVKLREPKLAFVGGNDGLDLYRRMIDQIILIKPKLEKSQKIYFFAEMMTWQVEKLQKEYFDLNVGFIQTFHFNIEILSLEI